MVLVQFWMLPPNRHDVESAKYQRDQNFKMEPAFGSAENRRMSSGQDHNKPLTIWSGNTKLSYLGDNIRKKAI